MLAAHRFKLEFEAYLKEVEDCKIHSLMELIRFNKNEAETELPPREPFHCLPSEAIMARQLIERGRKPSSRPPRTRILPRK